MGGQLVSVVVPTYNRAYCLPAAIGSLQAQSHPHWEAVIIDDGSKDDTADVVGAMAAKDARIRYLPQKNGGVSAARNAGIRAAQGDYVGFLDSDDAWEPWKLSAQIACLAQFPQVGMVWTNMNAFNAAGELVSPLHLRKMYRAYDRVSGRQVFEGQRKLAAFAPDIARTQEVLANADVTWGDVYSSMMFGNLVHTSTALLRRDRINAVGFFNQNYRTGEDYDFHLRTCREGPVALLDAPSIRYRVAGGEDQLTSRAHTLELARNALLTREAAIKHDRGRIQLSDAELGEIMGLANRWVAEELFDKGDFAGARQHYFRSRLLADRNVKLLAKVAITCFPASLAKKISGVVRKDGTAS